MKATVTVIVGFLIYYFGTRPYFGQVFNSLTGISLGRIPAYLITHILIGIPILASVLLLRGPKRFWSSLGLRKEVGMPLILALACTLPMFVGYGVMSGFHISLSLESFFFSVIAAAFFEELYFRGFLFGCLFRYTRFGFVPAVLLGAFLFAAAHIYQGNDPFSTLGIFAVTFMGAGLFAWVYAEWRFNLWGPIFLHLFMNLSWMLFAVGDNALGSVWANVFRALTITCVIAGTIIYKRRKNIPLSVARHNLWINPDDATLRGYH